MDVPRVDGQRSLRPVVLACLGGISAFQVSLAAGAPFGAIAYSGATAGVLPPSLRAASAGAALVWGSAAAAVATGRPRSRRARRAVYLTVAGAAGVGSLVNLASPSLPERMVWVPVTAVLAVSAWREAAALRPGRLIA